MIAAFVPPAITLGIVSGGSLLICIDAAIKGERYMTGVAGVVSIACGFLAIVLAVT